MKKFIEELKEEFNFEFVKIVYSDDSNFYVFSYLGHIFSKVTYHFPVESCSGKIFKVSEEEWESEGRKQ